MTTALLSLIIMLAPSDDYNAPPTPDLPPPLPTYITGGDGGRINCTPGYTQCWNEPGQVRGGTSGW